MRAVKRNIPARVLVTRATGAQTWHLIETFEQVNPLPIKVGELRLTDRVDFPPSPPAPYTSQPTGMQILFGPDGRMQLTPPADQVFTLRGVIGASVTNDLPVLIQPSGKIRVLGPNPTNSKPEGTEWH